MKVIINESEHGLEYAWEVVSACEKAGIQCIADERPNGEILFYDPKGRKYATDKELMDADVQIWDLFGDNGQKTDLYDEVMLDAVGKDFEKFSVKWNASQKQVGEKDIMATKNCSRIIGNYNETRIVGKRKPSKEFLDKVEKFKKKWRSLGKPKADDEEDYVDDFGDSVNGIEAQVSEGRDYLDDFKPIDSAFLDDDDPDFDLDDDGWSNDPDNYEYQDRMERRRKKAKADGKKVCFRCGDIFDPKDGGGVTKCGDEFCPGCSIDRKDMIVKWFKDQMDESLDSSVVYKRNTVGTMDEKMSDWYREAYPTDSEMADEMEIVGSTFNDLWRDLNLGRDVYKTIGADDSIVRERVFQHLSELTGKQYRTIYNMWLKSVDESFDSAVVYWKPLPDDQWPPSTFGGVHDIEGVLNEVKFMAQQCPEGDVPEIDHIKIGNKEYDERDIDRVRRGMEKDEIEMYRENYEDDPRDWSASEGEVEIMWTKDFPECGIESGDTDHFVVDYDLVLPNEYDLESNCLKEEVCNLIRKEYPDLDFDETDFDITNEREFWGDEATRHIYPYDECDI